jgi:hypothetical protein
MAGDDTQTVDDIRTRAPKWHARLRGLAPYVVAAAVVAWILHKYPLADIVAEARLGHAWGMLPWGLALPFVLWVPYAACDGIVLRGAVGPIAFRDVLRAKAATEVLLTLGYFFGGGGYAVWIARKMHVRAARAAGAVLYMMASDLVAVCAVAGASMWLGGLEVSHSLRTVATTIFGVQVLLILIGPYSASPRLPAVFEPWRTVPRAWGFAQIGGRTLSIAIITVFVWAAGRAFGIGVPLGVMAMYMPIILLITALPFSVAGFGAAQGAWLLLLPWASGPRILAFQVLWQVLSGVAMALRGLPFVPRVVAEIDAGAVLLRDPSGAGNVKTR